MIKAYLAENFYHPQIGRVLLVKMEHSPNLTQSVTRVLARGDWGEIDFTVTSSRWPDQQNSAWDIALTTTARLDWSRCQELILYFD